MTDKTIIVICPYCGQAQPRGDQCRACQGVFEPLSRRATQIGMGPWFVRDLTNPFRPGCSFEVVRKQIDRGLIGPTTIMRGPTTRQFWTVARRVPGVAVLLGYCDACGKHVTPQSRRCRHCGNDFVTPTERDELGLQYPSESAARRAQQALDEQLKKIDQGGVGHTSVKATAEASAKAAAEVDRRAGARSRPHRPKTGADLLDEVLSGEMDPVDAASDHAADFEPGSNLLRFDDRGTLPAPMPGDAEHDSFVGTGLNNAVLTGRLPRRERSGASWGIWLLVLSQLLMLGALIVMIVLFVSQQNGPPAGQETTPALSAGAATTSAGSAATNDGAATMIGASPDDAATGADRPPPSSPTGNDADKTAPPSGPPAVDQPEAGPSATPSSPLVQALALEKAGKLEEALNLLTPLAPTGATDAESRRIAEAIARLREKIEQKRLRDFFGYDF